MLDDAQRKDFREFAESLRDPQRKPTSAELESRRIILALLAESEPEVLGEAGAPTYPRPKDGWVCFHCGTRFTSERRAREHFGETPDAVVACIEAAKAHVSAPEVTDETREAR